MLEGLEQSAENLRDLSYEVFQVEFKKGYKMKNIIRKFQLIINCNSEEGIFMNAGGSFNGTVVIDLVKTVKIRSIMIGRSVSVHSSEMAFDNTRIGKQIYVESVKTLFGDEDCLKSFLHSSGEQIYEFQVPDHLPKESASSESATRLSWTNLKAVLVDDKGRTIFSDVFIQNLSSESEHAQNANFLANYKGLETNEKHPNRIHSPLVNASSGRKNQALNETYSNGRLIEDTRERLMFNVNYENEVHKFTRTRSGLDIQCKLKKNFYKMDESVTFIVQCENNTKKGYKQISASLTERVPESAQRFRRPSLSKGHRRARQLVTASIIGPPVGPKELVVWEGLLTPIISNASDESWYTLRIEVDTKFLKKEQIEIPVIIMDDPRTPTTNEAATKL